MHGRAKENYEKPIRKVGVLHEIWTGHFLSAYEKWCHLSQIFWYLKVKILEGQIVYIISAASVIQYFIIDFAAWLILIIIAVNLYIMYNRILKSLNPDVWNFTLMWSPLAIPFFQHFMTGPSKSGWDHVVDKFALPTLLLLCISFWALLGSVMYWVRLKAVMGCRGLWNETVFNSLISFIIPKSVCILVKKKLPCLFCFWGYFILLLMVFYKFLETNGCFTLNMDSSVCDSFIIPI